jgi:multidrug efflux pump subunit AcrA (membrane-fusion protein)
MKTVVVAIGLMAGAEFAALPLHRASAQADAATGAVVNVVKATTACFSDMVRVAGYLVPRRMAVVNVESDSYKITEVMVGEGDLVTSGQVLARLTRQASEGGSSAGGAGRQTASSIALRAPAAGLVIKSTARVREMASPQAEPLFQILVDNEVELEAQIPSIHVAKLRSGEIARVAISGGAERGGKVRLVSPDVDQKTQLGKVRLTVGIDSSLRIGMFARATIDARRSCGVAIPRNAVENRVEGASVLVVRDRTVEIRRVVVGLLSDDSIEIRQGLSEGDIIVATAGTSLHDGDKVRPMFAGESDQLRAR